MISDKYLVEKFGGTIINDAKWEIDDNVVSILKQDIRDNGSTSYTIKVNNKKDKFDVALIINENFDNIVGFCGCKDSHSKGVCKHMVMGIIEINKLLKKQSENEQRASTDTYKLELLKNIYKPHTKHDIISIFPFIRQADNTGVLLGLKASLMGQKPYIIKNVERFIEDVNDNRHLEIGKGFDTHNYAIDQQSINFLRELIILNSKLQKQGLNINTEILNYNQIQALLATKINQELFYLDDEFIIKDRLDDIVLHIDYIKSDEFSIKLKKVAYFNQLSDHLVINTANKIMYFLSYNQLQKIKLLDSFKETDKEFIVANEESEDFLNEVLPNIYNDFDIKFDSRFEFKIIDENFSASLFCYLENKVIKIKVNFKYGSYDVSDKKPNVLIKRNYAKENQVISQLINQGYLYNPDEECFNIEASKMQYYFLTKSLFIIKQDYEIFLDDKLQNAILNFDTSQIKIDINQENDLDYFEVNFDLNGIENQEIDAILKSFELKRDYHRLENDTFLKLNDSQLFYQLLFLKDVIGESSYKLNTFRMPKYKAFLVKEQAGQLFTNITSNQEFDDYIDKITLIDDMKEDVFKDHEYSLREYQKTGVNWLTNLYKSSLGALLADEMGLGKTLQVISFFNINKINNAIIVVPKALLYNWKNEFNKFDNSQNIVIIDGNKTKREALVKSLTGNEIVLISYTTLIHDYDYFDNRNFECVVIDEAQYIKNPTTKTSRTTKKINGNFFIALTGTPIENNLVELWSIFDFTIPGYLNDVKSFTTTYVNNKENIKKNVQTLKDITKPFILRRHKRDVLKELPDKIITDLYCEMPDNQKIAYATYIDSINKNDLLDMNSIEVLATITRLRQLSIDPGLFLDNFVDDNAKSIMFDEIIDEIVEGNEKVIVFSQYTSVLKNLQSKLTKKSIKYYYLDGETKPKQRMMDVEKFNKNNIPVYLISLKAGGVGLNLTSASKVIIYDPWWNPAVEAQAIDRAHRIGQKNKVQVFRFITKDTIEEKIQALNITKSELAKDILSDDVNYLNKLSASEIKQLLT